jgi:hypothetical protein
MSRESSTFAFEEAAAALPRLCAATADVDDKGTEVPSLRSSKWDAVALNVAAAGAAAAALVCPFRIECNECATAEEAAALATAAGAGAVASTADCVALCHPCCMGRSSVYSSPLMLRVCV